MLTQILTKTIGNPQILKNHKTIYTAIVHTDQSLDIELSKIETKIILINQYTPKFPLDYEMFMAIRIFCDLEFTTGNMIREQNQILLPKIFNQREDIQEFKGKGKQFERVNFIISQSLTNQSIYECLCFQEQTYSNIVTKTPFIVVDEQFQQFMKTHRISLVEQQKTFRDGLIYFQEQNPDKTIFLDIGPQQLGTILDLIDLYVITTYSGTLEDQFKLGKMPSFEKVLQTHNLIHQSEKIQEHQGFMQFSVFQNKRCQL